MTNKKSFVLYDNYFHQLEFLTMEQRGELFTAIFEYRVFGEVKTQLSQLTQVVFSFIKDTLERDADAYKQRCEANRENGRKGGRPPKKSSRSKTQKPKKADNDNDNDNGNDNDNENDNDNGIDKGNGINGNGAAIPSSSPPPVSDEDSVRLSEEEKTRLISLGVPAAYLREREERAAAYGRIHNQRAAEVLLSWWQKDHASRKGTPRASPEPRDVQKSYDLDEFFEAALARGMRDLSEE